MLAALLVSGCFFLNEPDPVAITPGKGGGTETEGIAVNPDGSVAAYARVTMRPADYLQDLVSTEGGNPTRRDTVTDQFGRFSFESVPTGDYRIEIAGTEARGAVHDFTVANDSEGVKLATDTLKTRGSIHGGFVTDSDGQLTRFVQVFGMERLITADREGGFIIYNLPEGVYDIRCSSLQPFRRDAVRRNIQVFSGKQTDIASVQLEKEAKLTFSVDSVGLKIGGVDGSNPVIFDNERWDNGVDNEYVWTKASLGSFSLRGNIVTNDHRSAQPSIATQMAVGREELRLAQLSGLRNIPDLVAGAGERLVEPASGLIEDIKPKASAGSDLIVAEARKATPERPLVVVVGGPLTTVAQAYLTDPSIATRMVVTGVFSYSIQVADSLANYLVAKKCRFVQWGRTYSWNGKSDTTRSKEIPLTRMGEKVRNYLSGVSGKLSFGDMAPAAFLSQRSLWKTAQMVKVSAKLEVQTASDITFDFLDIPETANNWPGYTQEFYSTLADPKAYAPKPVPGVIPAEGYLGRSGVTAIAYDTALASGGVSYATGAWTEYRVEAVAAGKFAVVLHYRSGAGGRLSFGVSGRPAPAESDLAAVAKWSDANADSIALDSGITVLRVTATAGKFDLMGLDLK
jgi:hypothetical protein